MEKKVYEVKPIDANQLNISGKLDAEVWANANEITNFVSPWKSVLLQPIIFKALYDTKHLYFNFQVSTNKIFTELEDNSKSSIGKSDRVELFIRANDQLSPYYCLEIDTIPRIMDFKAMPNQDFDFNWNWPKSGIKVKSDVLDNQFTVEGKISMQSLRELDLLKEDAKGRFLEIGVYLARYEVNINRENDVTWITWVDPKVPHPNFHIPDSFGEFRFLN